MKDDLYNGYHAHRVISGTERSGGVEPSEHQRLVLPNGRLSAGPPGCHEKSAPAQRQVRTGTSSSAPVRVSLEEIMSECLMQND